MFVYVLDVIGPVGLITKGRFRLSLGHGLNSFHVNPGIVLDVDVVVLCLCVW